MHPSKCARVKPELQTKRKTGVGPIYGMKRRYKVPPSNVFRRLESADPKEKPVAFLVSSKRGNAECGSELSRVGA